MRIALTGASGLVGRAFFRELRKAGHEVISYGRNADRAFDLADPIVDMEGIDWLIHAGFAHVPGKYRGGEGDDPEGFRRLNLNGSCALFEQATYAGVSHITFLSSRAVYDGFSGERATEDVPLAPTSLYGQVKLEAEVFLKGLKTQSSALRATGVYEAGDNHKWKAIFNSFKAGENVAPRAGTELHAKDLVAAADLSRVNCIETVNLSDMMIDRHDLLRAYAEIHQTPGALPPRATEHPQEMDCTRMREIGWRPGGWPLLKDTLKKMG